MMKRGETKKIAQMRLLKQTNPTKRHKETDHRPTNPDHRPNQEK